MNLTCYFYGSFTLRFLWKSGFTRHTQLWDKESHFNDCQHVIQNCFVTNITSIPHSLTLKKVTERNKIYKITLLVRFQGGAPCDTTLPSKGWNSALDVLLTSSGMVTLVVLFLTLCLFYLRGKEGREREKDCRVNVENNIGLDIIRKFSLLLFYHGI